MAKTPRRYLKALVLGILLEAVASTPSTDRPNDFPLDRVTEQTEEGLATEKTSIENSEDHKEHIQITTLRSFADLEVDKTKTYRDSDAPDSLETTTGSKTSVTTALPSTATQEVSSEANTRPPSNETNTGSKTDVITDLPVSSRQEVNFEVNTEPTPETTTVSSTTVTTTLAGPGKQEISSEDKTGCPDFGVKQVARSVIKCQCQGDEIMLENGKCQKYEGILIPFQYRWIYTREVGTENTTVIIKDAKCDLTKYMYREFIRGQFQIRERGDIVLLDTAGVLQGQRLNNYCITHHLDDHDELTWTLKACVPIPSVPRCCPFGYAMKDGVCQEAKTPRFLKPPINAKPFGNPVEWENITNYHSPLTCKTMPVYTIPLDYKESNLVSLAYGLENAWVPGVTGRRRVYHKCPKYCVDGIEDSDGSVEYFTSFCYKDPIEEHNEACRTRPCLRKCCEHGLSMDKNRFSCVKDPKTTFNQAIENVERYNFVTGWPLCSPPSEPDGNFSIDLGGNMIVNGRTIPSTDFCLDTFLDNDQRKHSALACLTETSTWAKVRPILFPICHMISLVFLSINIICHLLVPKLLSNGGLHQLMHSVALVIANFSSSIVHVFHSFFTINFCVIISLVMQFGYLTTFFWLNVLCFEIWRKIRRLKNFKSCQSYPNKYYMLYGWGIPFCMCIFTAMMQYLAPDNVPGVIKPYFGVTRCWFKEELALFIYFYGPVAFLFACNLMFIFLTFLNYNLMKKKYLGARQALRDIGTKDHSHHNTLSSMPNRRITDYVQEFIQKLLLFILMATCWVTEVLSWKIPPPELWALTDTLNCLQGLFIFFILLCNSNKRKQIEEKCPLPFKLARKYITVPEVFRKYFWGTSKDKTQSSVKSLTSTFTKSITKSSIINSFASSIKSTSSSSFDLSSDPSSLERSSSLDGCENGVVALSHARLDSSNEY